MGDGLSSTKGLALGAGAAALLPLAAKGVTKMVGGGVGEAIGGLGSKVESGLGSKVSSELRGALAEAGGPSGVLKDTLKSALPFGGGHGDGDDDGGGNDGAPGVGKGRRMPVQQAVDIGAPLETVYNQWTQFELWPNFMHRVTRVTQEDDCTVAFTTKIWGKSKEFKAKIETQRPDERLKWKVTEGMAHTGVVTFHELGPRLTRVLLGMDVDPGGPLEKAARGLRHVKRAARGDLHRFKAFVEMTERETGAWRGTIERGEVVEPHDAGYDKRREYADLDEVMQGDDVSGAPASASDGGSSSRGSSSRGRSSQSRSTSKSRSTTSSRSRSAGNSRGREGGQRSGSSRRSSPGHGTGSASGRRSPRS